jgi:DNA-binding NarL/FixJ family response regulator
MGKIKKKQIEKTRIVLALEIPLIRDSLRELIDQEQDMEVVAITGDNNETVSITSKLQPDLLITDVILGDLKRLEIMAPIVKKCPNTKILVFTVKNNDDIIDEILKSGASGYLPIISPNGIIIHVIRETVSGEKSFGLAAPANLQNMVDKPKKLFLDKSLTARDISLIKLVARGYSNKAISENLGLSLHYVKAKLTAIYDKLGVSSRTQVISFCLQYEIIELSDLNHFPG